MLMNSGGAPALNKRQGDTDMAKSQKRSNREVRKPKAAKTKPVVALAKNATSPVDALMRKPKDRL
jgi:hypothetical protein